MAEEVKFKIGDKVKVTSSNTGQFAGRVGIIREIDSDYEYSYRVNFEDGQYVWSKVVPVTKSSIKFSVGQRVIDAGCNVNGKEWTAIVVAIIKPSANKKVRRYVLLHESSDEFVAVRLEEEVKKIPVPPPSLSGKEVTVTLDGQTYKAIIK